MARKKTTRQTKTAKSTLAEQMIAVFKATPAKIIAQLRKEIATVKQYHGKLKTDLAKTQALLKAAKQKSMDLGVKLKTKSTPTLRKQISKTKKSLEQLNKTTSSLTAQLTNTQKQLSTLNEKYSNFANVAKNINQLNKQPIKKKTKPKMQKRSAKSTTTMAPTIKKPAVTTQITPEELDIDITSDEPVEIS